MPIPVPFQFFNPVFMPGSNATPQQIAEEIQKGKDEIYQIGVKAKEVADWEELKWKLIVGGGATLVAFLLVRKLMK